MAAPVNQSVLDIMKSHRWVRQMEANELSEFETAPVLDAVSQLDLGPCHLDIGRLAVAYYDKGRCWAQRAGVCCPRTFLSGGFDAQAG
ncbi:MAG: hypothetical protein CM15mP84_03810 [Cellvibrionales bacterium]|nr:MAG: hypothetical protein CM15mP84_03810 [Cellvibrionales bacterium]